MVNTNMNVYVDGSGAGSWCFYVVETASVRKGHMNNPTNNKTEYQAIIQALEYLQNTASKSITIHSDSQLVVNQINHEYNIKDAELLELAMKVWALIEEHVKHNTQVTIVWVPRELNKAGKILG